jgi:hypothetical protein
MDQQQQWPRNPLGIESAAAALQRADQSLTLGLVVVMVLCAASLLVRFRRAQGIERQQLKWFSYAIALFALVFVAYLLTTLLWGEWLSNTASDVVFGIGYGLIPVSAGIAILRYRLYDIDRVINRSLVYGLLTALLGGIYMGVILLCGQLFGGITDDPPSWAIAGATLAVAPYSSRLAAASSGWWIGASTGAATTPPGRSMRLASGCATRSTSTP